MALERLRGGIRHLETASLWLRQLLNLGAAGICVVAICFACFFYAHSMGATPLGAFNNILLVAAGTTMDLAVFTQCVGRHATSIDFPLCAAKAAQPAREVVPALRARASES